MKLPGMRSVLVLVGSTVVLAAAPGVAGATTFCVNDPVCVAGGGTSQPSINAAEAAAQGNGVVDDLIRIGASATPYQLASTVNFSEATHGEVTIAGAGRSATQILAPIGAVAFDLNTDGGTGLVDLSVTSSHSIVLLLTDSSLQNVNVTSTSTTAGSRAVLVGYEDASTSIASSNISVPVTTSDSKGIEAVSPSGNPTLFLAASTVRGETGIDVYDTTFGLYSRSSSIAGTKYGIQFGTEFLPNVTSNLLLLSSLVELVAPLQPNAAAVFVRGTAGNDIHQASFVDSTINNTNASGSDAGVSVVANKGGAPFASLDVQVIGTAIAGPAFRSVLSTYAAGNTVTIGVQRSAWQEGYFGAGPVWTIAPSVQVLTAAQMQFVDYAGRDYRLRATSPLIDTGRLWTNDPEDEFMHDLGGLQRWATGLDPASATRAGDVGAHEYHRLAPVIESVRASGSAAPGSAMRFDVVASDPNGVETASLAYAWSLPGGGTARGTGVTATLPTTPGTYDVTVTVTDVTGAATASTSRLTIPPPGAPPTVIPVVLEDVTNPKVQLVPARASLAKLLARVPGPVTATATANEPVKLRATLQAVVTLPKVGRKPAVKKTVLLGTFTSRSFTARTAVRIVPTAAGLRSLRPLLATTGARTVWTLVSTATDAAGNATNLSTKVTVAR